MPRLKKTESQRRSENFEELYRIGKARSGLTDAQCADIIGVCRKTLFAARKSPNDRVSIGQLARFGEVFGWSDEDYLKIIKAQK